MGHAIKEKTKGSRSLIPCGILTLCLAGIYFAGDRMFVFPFGMLAVPVSPTRWRHILTPDSAFALNILPWLLVVPTFGWFARGISIRWHCLLIPALILLVVLITHWTVRLLGYGFYWELWR